MRANPFSSRSSRTRVLAIASGKGGVGKSSVTVNLAVTLSRLGYRVGLLDADIYGFSAPRMLEVGYPPLVLGKVIVPPVAHGVRCISMGFFYDEDKAVAWRGPMLHKALEQFLVDVHWGTLDFLVVDMPPGTGDVPLSVGQQLPRAEIYVVTTPQIGAMRVAQRAAALAKQLRHPVRGVIENMSWFITPDGARYTIFGSGGGAQLAETLSVPLLAQIPLVPMSGEGDDDGIPDAVVHPSGAVSTAFRDLAIAIVESGPPRVYRSELSIS
jgi:ATP-binding protein involved in chromosome partitioning